MDQPPYESFVCFNALGGTVAAASAPAPQTGTAAAVSALLWQAVAPHVVTAAGANQGLYVAAADERIAALMRGLLHDPAFQRLEAAWRGLAWLVSSLPAGEELTISALDVRRADLLADLRAAGGELPRTALYRLLVEETVGTPGGNPWSLIAADVTIGPDGEDIALAAALAALGAAAEAPVVAAASPRLLGCASLVATPDPRDWPPLPPGAEARWRELRAFAHAGWLGLALPRVLLRHPYGAHGEPIEAFALEERAADAGLEQFLWGSPALAVAILVAQAALECDEAGGAGRALDDLPAYVAAGSDGEKRLQPCAETLLSDRAGDAIVARGLMPLLSNAREASVLLPRLRSIAAAD